MAASIFNLDNSNIAPAAGIKASKLEGEFAFSHSQTGAAAATKQYVHAVKGANATVLSFVAAVTETLPAGGDSVTVNLKKSSGGGAFSSILSAAISLTSGSTLKICQTASISSPALVAGDLLMIEVTVSGSSAEGLVASIVLREDAP